MGTPVLGVVMVSASFHPHVGGAEKQALELSAALKSRGLSVRVATRAMAGQPASEEIRGIRVDRLSAWGAGPLNAATFMLSLARYLRAQAPFYEAVHVHLAGSPAVTAALMARLQGKRVVVKLGGGKGIGELAASSRTGLGRLKLRALSLLKPQFVAVARELADEASRYLGKVPVHIIPNGVDTRKYAPVDARRKAELRAALGWPAQGQCFLYVGRFSPEKRLPLFMEEWCEAVKAKRPPSDAFAAFVGDGVEGELVRKAARAARMEGRVFIHPPMDDVERAYGAADVFVLPSASEGLSNALLEAMASGLGILASAVGGAVDAVVNAESGLLFPADDRAALRSQIDKLLNRPELAVSFGRAARAAALERFSLEKVAERYEEIYRWGLP